jgi:FkbM family methyltransferase
MFSVLKNNYPIEAILKDEHRIIMRNLSAIWSYAKSYGLKEIEYNISEKTWNISAFSGQERNNELKLRTDLDNGEIISIFLYDIYGWLPVKRKNVVDIGANIGDSAIYFARHGASKVIAVEPFHKNHEIATYNIMSNNLSNRIVLLLAACSSIKGQKILDPSYESNIDSQLSTNFKYGERVPLLTLEDILNENGLFSDENILKMDCEECEYNVLVSAPTTVLRRFSHIQIEYHKGYRILSSKLEKSGFSVITTRPTAYPAGHQLNQWHYVGHIYAERID